MVPSLSIIIPVYNVEAYLKQCLDSVLVDNAFQDQVICVNDGSTDGSLAILNQYATKYPNVEVYTQKNQGQSVARNTGLDKAKGDYVLFLDSDDYYSKGAIEHLTKLAVKNPEVDFFYMDCAITSEGERFYTLRNNEPIKMSLIDYYDYESAQYGSTPQGCVCGGFYKREFIERNHLRMLPGCRYEDELFIFEVFLQSGICMTLHVDQPYYNYRIGREGATTAKYTLLHFFNRRSIVHACYDAMVKSKLLTIARKRKVFDLCEENLIQAYLFGFKSEIKQFFTNEDVRILKECATSERDNKLFRLASISPKLLAAYRTEKLLSIIRRMINKFL